jgi:hypothetical protein
LERPFQQLSAGVVNLEAGMPGIFNVVNLDALNTAHVDRPNVHQETLRMVGELLAADGVQLPIPRNGLKVMHAYRNGQASVVSRLAPGPLGAGFGERRRTARFTRSSSGPCART